MNTKFVISMLSGLSNFSREEQEKRLEAIEGILNLTKMKYSFEELPQEFFELESDVHFIECFIRRKDGGRAYSISSSKESPW